MIYNELMSDFEMDEKDFAADSWSLAVDSSFLQQHKKEVMKQQDVIYGEPRPPAAPPSAGPRPRPLLRRTRPRPLRQALPAAARASPTRPPQPLGLQDPAWHPTSCLQAPNRCELLVSQAPSLSLPSSQFLGFTLHLFGALRLARDCGERRCLEDPVVSAGGGAGAGGLKATGGLENDLRFTRWSINLEGPSEPQVSPEVPSLVPPVVATCPLSLQS